MQEKLENNIDLKKICSMNLIAEFTSLIHFIYSRLYKIGSFFKPWEKPCTKWQKWFSSYETNFKQTWLIFTDDADIDFWLADSCKSGIL